MSQTDSEMNAIDQNITSWSKNNINIERIKSFIQPEVNHSENDELIQETQTTFKDLGLSDEICRICKSIGWITPTPIQCATISFLMSVANTTDFIGVAQCGSGKTGAYALYILQQIYNRKLPFYAMVVVESKELAAQIYAQFVNLGKLLNITSCLIISGIETLIIKKELMNQPNVIIGTCERVSYILQNHCQKLENLKYLVIDECDSFIKNLGSKKALKVIYKLISHLKVKKLLFTATLSDGKEALEDYNLYKPKLINLCLGNQTNNALQYYFFVPEDHKITYLMHLVSTDFFGHPTIIFCSSCKSTFLIGVLLRKLGIEALPLNSEMSVTRRLEVVEKFKENRRGILVATFCAVRGMDFPTTDVIINYSLPPTADLYIHCIGRTARAGRSGYAINFVTQYSIVEFKRLETALNYELSAYSCKTDISMDFHNKIEIARVKAIEHVKDYLKFHKLKEEARSKKKKLAKSKEHDDQTSMNEIQENNFMVD